MTTFRVSAEANINSLAAAIAGAYADSTEREVCLHCIGPRSVNNGVKAVATAKRMMELDGRQNISLVIRPEFMAKMIRGEKITAVALTVRAEEVEA